MRGKPVVQQSMFVAFDLEQRVPDDHPLRPIKVWCDRLLAGMSRDFNRAYGAKGQVSIPPESLLKCLLLRALFGIPSERRLCEACEFNLLYRWFLDWPIERPMWTPEVFSTNRGRFELHDIVRKFFDRVVAEGIAEGLIRDDRFSVDGTLVRSLAGHKSVKPIDDDSDDDDLNSWGEFKGKRRSNTTHRSVVDPESRLASRGGEAHPSHSMHVPAESESGLGLSVAVDAADWRAVRRCALAMPDRVERRHASRSYRVSQRARRLIEPVIGWCKDVGGLRRTGFIGRRRIQDHAMVVASACNLLRMVSLTEHPERPGPPGRAFG